MAKRKTPLTPEQRFVQSNAEMIDDYILLRNPTLRGQIDYEERKLWVREDSYLRGWAAEAGVDLDVGIPLSTPHP